MAVRVANDVLRGRQGAADHPANAHTVWDCFRTRVCTTPDLAAFTAFRAGAWQTMKWRAVLEDVGHWVELLRRARLCASDRCVTISENRYEWLLLDLAIQFFGAIHVPLSPLQSREQLLELIDHCQPALIVISTEAIGEKLDVATWHGKRPWIVLDTGRVHLVDGNEGTEGNKQHALSSPSGRSEVHEMPFDSGNRTPVGPEDLLTILYTSGTTGEPKGVMLSHENVMSNVRAKLATLTLDESDVRLAWLPWTHIFGRVCDLYTGIAAGCHTIISRGRDYVFDELHHFRPTYLNGVPYLYEKCYRMLLAQGTEKTPGALRRLLGGRIRLCNCGGAPLADHVFDYFREQGVDLVCGYGLTETSPVLTSNRVDAWRRGSVGQAVPGVALRVADDGEILARGPNVMRGYYRDPKRTAEVLSGGWLHTGDLGRLDDDGFLYLEGRKKELIVLNTGLKVAPTLIEHQLMADNPLIHQCMVVGEGRNYLAALIVLDLAELRRRWPSLQVKGGEPPVWEEPTVRRAVTGAIQRALKDRARHEQIGRFLMLTKPFSLEDGLVTPKQSLRREAIAARFANAIEQLYAQAATPHGA